MLILLPPSEGKTAPTRGKALEQGSLSFPSLRPTRERLVDALVTLCRDEPGAALATLGLGPGLADLVTRNADLLDAPTARADAIYTGVLYDALGFASLSPAAKRRAGSRIAIASALFGLVRPGDRIPAYRLSGDASLPGIGSVAGAWREVYGEAVAEGMGSGLLVDLRSGTYAAFWRPTQPARTATVRVLHEVGGVRKVVSHFNKATKGRIVRDLLEAGAAPRTPARLAADLTDLGWYVEVGDETAKGTQLDVVVSDV